MSKLKATLRTALQRRGFDILRLKHEPWVYDAFKVQQQLLRDVAHPMIFDVGANVGQTLLSYMAVLPNARIQCFEPFPNSFKELSAKAAGYPSASVNQLALADQVGEQTFYTNPEYHTRNSLLPRPNSEGRRYFREKAELSPNMTVGVDTIDHFRAEKNIDHIDALKLDVQGAEMMVLQGARETLAANAVSLVFTEILVVPHYEGGPTFQDIDSMLQDYGLSFFNIYDLRPASNGQLRYANVIYVSRSLRAEVVDAFPPEE